MEGQNRLRLEDAVMLDKKKILYQVTRNKSFNIKISEPFNQLSIEFLNDFSNVGLSYRGSRCTKKLFPQSHEIS